MSLYHQNKKLFQEQKGNYFSCYDGKLAYQR